MPVFNGGFGSELAPGRRAALVCQEDKGGSEGGGEGGREGGEGGSEGGGEGALAIAGLLFHAVRAAGI